MKRIPLKVKSFFETQGFVIVATIDKSGGIHCSAKGIVGISRAGKIYLIDLYKGRTFRNLCMNPTISITAVDEYRFIGYTLKGKAFIVEKAYIRESLLKSWEERVIKRISQRIVKSVQGKRSNIHPEARFPSPQYLIKVDVEEVIDLTPSSLKKSKRK